MKIRSTIKLHLILLFIASSFYAFSQSDYDTTRMRFKDNQFIFIKRAKDTTNTSYRNIFNRVEAHWAGLEFGPTMLMNGSFKTVFPTAKQWENDPGKSFSWNFNFAEYKFKIYHNFVGFTTGLGVNWTQIGLRDNQLLYANSDSLWVVKDTLNDYKRNKLRAVYIQVPLLFEFCTNKKTDKGFYFAVGVIGGIKVASSTVQLLDIDKKRARTRTRGAYALNPFKIDATFRFGYRRFGLFTNYSMTPMFLKNKTVGVYPLTVGLTFNL